MSRTPDRDRSLDRMIEAALRERRTDLPPADSSGCIDPERLATWSEGGLSIAESRQVEAHLSTCARCQSMAAAFARSAPALPSRVPWYRRWEVRWLMPALAGASAIALAIWMREPVTGPGPLAPAPQAAVAQDAPAPKKESAPIAENRTAPPRVDAKPRERAESRAQAAPMAPPVTMPPAAQGQALPEMRQLPPPSAPAQTGVAPPPAATAPPPPAAPPPVAASAEIQAKSAKPLMRDAIAFRESVKLADASAVVLEFTAPGGAGSAPAAGAAGRGGGGRGGGGAARQVAAAPGLPLRWRVLASGRVSRSVDGGATWTPVELDSALHITHGAAPAARVCWLVGRAGVVLLSIDGASFRRVAFPAATDLVSIRATSERDATITSSDRRTFTTADGGVTWRE